MKDDWPPEYNCSNCGWWKRMKPSWVERLFGWPTVFGRCKELHTNDFTHRHYICHRHTASWKALGITTYEGANGKAIWEIVEALKNDAERYQKDAERYQWLRKRNSMGTHFFRCHPEELDAAIDAGINEMGKS